MIVDEQGSLLIVDRHHKVFRLRAGASHLETVAGTGASGFAGDGGPADSAKLFFPSGVAINRDGDVLIADHDNCRIRKVDGKTRVITTVAGTGQCMSSGDGGPAIHASLSYPEHLSADREGNLFFVEGGEDRVRRIDASGMISTYAGTAKAGFGGDGHRADKAMLNNPSGLALDSDGNLYISEFVNNRIRRVDAKTYKISTIAGDGGPERIDVVM